MNTKEVKVANKNLSVLEYYIEGSNIRVWAIPDTECRFFNLLYINDKERILKQERVWIENREEIADSLVSDRLKSYFRFKGPGEFKTKEDED